jgi:hypothetical protein
MSPGAAAGRCACEASAAGAAGAAGAGAGAAAAGAAGAAVGTGVTGGSGAAGAGAGAAAAGATGTGVGAAGAAGAAAGAGVGVAAGAGALAAADFFAGAGAAGMASRSRRATGGSIVDEADLTNSPISLSLFRTSLLVTPSSFASSWTRTFDTSLLSWSGAGCNRTVSASGTRSCLRAHGVCILELPVCSTGGGHRRSFDRHERTQRSQVQRTGYAQCSRQRLGPLGAVQALLARVEACASTWQSTTDVRDSSPGDRDDPNQVRRGGSIAASHAHSNNGARRHGRTAHGRVYPVAHPSTSAALGGGEPGAIPIAASDRMSMRQPVRRAARRAFWPSRPIASDSW